jgi:hypothetical protein
VNSQEKIEPIDAVYNNGWNHEPEQNMGTEVRKDVGRVEP